jgi:hypothetical protein
VTALLLEPSPASVKGHVQPRIFTPPLRELTPETSYGFAVIEFARDVLCEPLDPWQEWLVIHAGELLPDGRPRFRQVLVLVARQNGKTHALKVLGLYWQFVEMWPLILGMSTNLDYAREAWEKAVEAAEAVQILKPYVKNIRRANGEQCLETVDGSRYKIAASNRKGGRSLSIDRLVIDELREHDDWEAWNAAVPAMNARPHAQVFAITNQGDDKSVVLDSLYDQAIAGSNPRLGVFEWSAPQGCAVDDPEAWAAANPNLGHRIDPDAISGDAARAVEQGGAVEMGFRTEVLCQRVKLLNPAIHVPSWEACKEPATMDDLRSRVALCLDVSPDSLHATLYAAAVQTDGRARVEVVAAWDGKDCLGKLRRELPGYVKQVRPRALGWFPKGPAAAIAADLEKRSGILPPSTKVSAITADTTAVCMGFSEQVTARQIAHSDEPLLNVQVAGAERLKQGDQWRFTRSGSGHVDALYAAAGAVHLARTIPSIGKPRIVTARDT